MVVGGGERNCCLDFMSHEIGVFEREKRERQAPERPNGVPEKTAGSAPG